MCGVKMQNIGDCLGNIVFITESFRRTHLAHSLHAQYNHRFVSMSVYNTVKWVRLKCYSLCCIEWTLY
jgi:hypothetical protein